MPTKIQIELCAVCGADLARVGRHGVAVTIGHSRGGWGRRENSIEWLDEICKECAYCITSRMRALFETILFERKDYRVFVVATDPGKGVIE